MAGKIVKDKKTKAVKLDNSKAETSGKSTSKKKVDEEDDDLDAEEINDDWGKSDEDNWDPDFEEFDMPVKSTKAKGKSKKEEEDDFSLDDDLKNIDDDDLFEEKDELDDDY